MQFKGTHEFEEFWSYLCDETPRGLAVVIAAYFDEKLGVVFPAAKNKRFGGRIRDALLAGLICRSEHDALQIIRGLRNSFGTKSGPKTSTRIKRRRSTHLSSGLNLPPRTQNTPNCFPALANACFILQP